MDKRLNRRWGTIWGKERRQDVLAGLLFECKRLLPLCALLLIGACTRAGVLLANAPEYVRGGYTRSTAVYAPDLGLALDIYQPVPHRPVDAAADVIVFLHGGSWTYGNKNQYRFLGATLARQGYVAVIPDYRKFPDVRFPVFVADAAKALAWVQDHSQTFGGNPARIFLAGHSAGAHIGALLAADPSYLAAEGKTPQQVIRAFAGLAGPYAFTPETPYLKAIFGPPERFDQMQVPTFITGREPPMLLQYGLMDTDVGAINHQRLADAVMAKGGWVRIATYPQVGHIGLIRAFSWLSPNAPVLLDMLNFFRAPHSAADRP